MFLLLFACMFCLLDVCFAVSALLLAMYLNLLFTVGCLCHFMVYLVIDWWWLCAGLRCFGVCLLMIYVCCLVLCVCLFAALRCFFVVFMFACCLVVTC